MSGAAAALGTNVATVSRRIDRINEALGIPALIKRSDGWEVNPRLEGLMSVIEEFDGGLERELNALRATGQESRSRVSIGCTPTVSGRVLFPGLARDRSPPANVDFSFSARTFAEGLGDFDIVVRIDRPESGRVVSRLAGTLPLRFYRPIAAPDATDWVGLHDTYDRLEVMRYGHRVFGKPPTIRVANFEQLIEVVHSVKLPAPLPAIIAHTEPELEVMPGSISSDVEYWLMYHQTRRNDPVIRSAVEWIVACFHQAQNDLQN